MRVSQELVELVISGEWNVVDCAGFVKPLNRDEGDEEQCRLSALICRCLVLHRGIPSTKGALLNDSSILCAEVPADLSGTTNRQKGGPAPVL